MSVAAEAITDLDGEIAEAGQDVVLRRIVANGPAIERTVRAFVRGYVPTDLEGGLQQGQSRVVVSPTGLPPEFADADATRLRKNDEVEFDGRSRNVEFVDPVRMSGTLVRLNLTVEG